MSTLIMFESAKAYQEHQRIIADITTRATTKLEWCSAVFVENVRYYKALELNKLSKITLQ
jgi:hypothetical protein